MLEVDVDVDVDVEVEGAGVVAASLGFSDCGDVISVVSIFISFLLLLSGIWEGFFCRGINYE